MTQGSMSPRSTSSQPTQRRRLGTPDWGSTHLTSDAVVAFVDDELARRPHERAVAHVASCAQCTADVIAQRQARSALRAATCPSLPSSLMSALRAIPQDTDLPEPPAGLAVADDGTLVSIQRTEPRRPAEPLDAAHGRRTSRMRIGAGAAVSGLAIGALAFGATALPAVVAAPVAPEDRGVFDGPVLTGGTSARFALEGTPTDVEARLMERVAAGPRTYLP